MSEKCMRCSIEYPTVWGAPHWLWNHIVNQYGAGQLCIACFDALARERGVELRWSCDPHWLGNIISELIAKMGEWHVARRWCRECGHVQRSVWPDGADPTSLECGKCGAMACGPDPDDKPLPDLPR